MEPLPRPDSPRVAELGLGRSQLAIYRVLYEHRARGVTMTEIRELLTAELGVQEQLDRRRRDLNKFFVIERSGTGSGTRYQLKGAKPRTDSDRAGISERVRAEVLRAGRCDMCGRTPREHAVVLQVDHRLPQSWGGSDDITNLQPLCEECNRGKKAYYTSLDAWGPAITAASAHEEVHRRIVTLLTAVAPEEVRSDVLEIVAHQQQFQEDWQKRMRELRALGWDYEFRREREPGGRVRTYYRLTRSGLLPALGEFRRAIRRAENG